jgi:hypothetical protein
MDVSSWRMVEVVGQARITIDIRSSSPALHSNEHLNCSYRMSYVNILHVLQRHTAAPRAVSRVQHGRLAPARLADDAVGRDEEVDLPVVLLDRDRLWRCDLLTQRERNCAAGVSHECVRLGSSAPSRGRGRSCRSACAAASEMKRS